MSEELKTLDPFDTEQFAGHAISSTPDPLNTQVTESIQGFAGKIKEIDFKTTDQ